MKKAFYVVMACLLLLLAGCGGEDKSPSDAGQSSSICSDEQSKGQESEEISDISEEAQASSETSSESSVQDVEQSDFSDYESSESTESSIDADSSAELVEPEIDFSEFE